MNGRRIVIAGFIFHRCSKSATSEFGGIENIWWGFLPAWDMRYTSEKETKRSKATIAVAPSLALVAGFDRGDFSHCVPTGKRIRRVVACSAWEVAV